MYMGVKVVIAKSFERIHSANLVNFGILPLTFKSQEDFDRIEQGDNLEIRDIRSKISKNDMIIVKNTTKNIEFEVNYSLSDRARDIILAGGALPYVSKKKQ